MRLQPVVFSMCEMSSGSCGRSGLGFFWLYILLVYAFFAESSLVHGSLYRWQGCRVSTKGKCALLGGGNRVRDDGFDAISFTFDKRVFLNALEGRSVVFSFLELWRHLQLSCSSRHVGVTRSEPLTYQCYRPWRKSKQLCKPHHMSVNKNTVLSSVCISQCLLSWKTSRQFIADRGQVPMSHCNMLRNENSRGKGRS